MGMEENFNIWIKQFIKDYGHSWGFGFYVELNTGEYFDRSSPEYQEWFNNKRIEYQELNK